MAKEKKQEFVTHITPRDEDFSQWYTDVILKTELCDYAPVRGCMIVQAHTATAIWELHSGGNGQAHSRKPVIRTCISRC